MLGIGLNPRTPISGSQSAPWWTSQYPGASFVADFANNRAMIDGNPAALTDFLSITRNSSGVAENSDGTLINHSPNTLRLSNQGVQIESSRTNLVADSEDFMTANWSPLGPATISSSSEPAPDGTLTAHHIQNLSATGHGIQFTDPFSTPIANGSYTGSIYLKADSATSLELAISSLSGSGSPSTLSLNLTTDWQRFTLPHNFSSDDTDFIIQLTRPPSDSIEAFYAWGAQLEAGTYETSYIKTSNAQTPREADSINFTDLSWLDQTTGTILLSVQSPQNTITNRRLLGFSSAQGLDTSPAPNVIEEWNGSTLLAASTSSQTWQSGAKVALAWDSNGRSLCIGGGIVGTDAELVSGLSSWFLGSRDGNQAFWEGYHNNLAYHDYRMSDGQIQGLTS